jgi:hypothetical protein
VLTTSAAERDYLADDPDDPSRKLIRHVLKRVRAQPPPPPRAGRRRKAEAGGYIGGRTRSGYRATLAAERSTLARLVELRTEGL